MGLIFGLLINGLIFGAACSYLAKAKGKDGCTWFGLGFFLGLIGLLIIGFLPSEQKDSEPYQQDIRQAPRPEPIAEEPQNTASEQAAGNAQGRQESQNSSSASRPAEAVHCYTYQLEPKTQHAPVYVSKLSVEVDSERGKVQLKLKLTNLSEKQVSACKCRVFCYDSFGAPIEQAPRQGGRILLQDLELPGKGECIPPKRIDLSAYPETRKCDVVTTDVLFSDRTTWQTDMKTAPANIVKQVDGPLEETVSQERETETFSVGEIGPAGGLVFYDKGSYAQNWRYLEAAPSFTEWEGKQWGNIPEDLETGTEAGAGKQNTENIIDVLLPSEKGKSAAGLCRAFSYGGFSDWFLPSRDELSLLIEGLHPLGLGNIAASGFYWSSSHVTQSDNLIWVYKPDEHGQGQSRTDMQGRVRAVRRF